VPALDRDSSRGSLLLMLHPEGCPRRKATLFASLVVPEMRVRRTSVICGVFTSDRAAANVDGISSARAAGMASDFIAGEHPVAPNTACHASFAMASAALVGRSARRIDRKHAHLFVMPRGKHTGISK
jgi:hypothetical protein